ncbi:MAG TPA: MazG nucleotide pyrophosphohydrolase domain-containing protein [Chitinophagaceae bacterium]|jgi:NTP pyrophosphatase (non-canonical NTP hydrolase)
MKFSEYQKLASETAVYPGRKSKEGLVYVGLGLGGEAGEIQNKLKKILRGDTELTESFIHDLGKEIGDLCWYISELASNLDLDLDEVVKNNVEKLWDRKVRNVIKGSGDSR